MRRSANKGVQMRLFIMSLLMLATAAPALAASEPKTREAVIADDEAWGQAEVTGDTRFIGQLLLPGYVSINPDGTVHDRAAILRSASTRTGNDAAIASMKAKSDAYKAAHPHHGEVSFFGDTAIIKWVSDKPGAGEPVSSCDIFVYRDGHWHAIYSQHTTAGS
jgi:hypothetical protein